MQIDPFEARRTGAHRLRVVTASIGAAALVGTGALAWSVAANTASASAGTTSGNGGVSGDGSTGASTGPTTTTNGNDQTTTNGNDQFVVPRQLPQPSTFGGSSHASSGGS